MLVSFSDFEGTQQIIFNLMLDELPNLFSSQEHVERCWIYFPKKISPLKIFPFLESSFLSLTSRYLDILLKKREFNTYLH